MPKILPAAPQPAAPVNAVGAPTNGAASGAVTPPTPPPSIVRPKEARPIRFPEIMVNGVVIPRKNLRVTVQNAKQILQYETEQEYRRRRLKLSMASDPTADQRISAMSPEEFERATAAWVFRPPGMTTDHKDYPRLANAIEAHFADPSGDLVVCWRNVNNRELRESWVRELMQDAAERGWSLNLEPMIVGKTGLVLSAQHRLVMLVWLWVCWSGRAKGDQWRELTRLVLRHWRDEEPYIESLVACGAEEDDRTLMTYDNTMVREDRDNYVQLKLFDEWLRKVPTPGPRGADGKQTKIWVDAPLNGPQKGECGKMLQKAVDMLWVRTGAGAQGVSKRTKSKKATLDFVKSHPTLLECVKHVWLENGGNVDEHRDGSRGIDTAKLSAGECAAMLYLMGSCRSSREAYVNKPSTADRNEAGMDWQTLGRARDFFSVLSQSHSKYDGPESSKTLFAPFHNALGLTCDPRFGLGQKNSTPEEKRALVAKAWAAYLRDGKIHDEDVALRYAAETDGQGRQTSKWLDECPLFGGIDAGQETGKPLATDPEPPREQVTQVEANKEQVAQRRAAREGDAAEKKRIAESARENQRRGTPRADEDMRAKVNAVKALFPGKLLLYVQNGSPIGLKAFDTDAMVLARAAQFPLDDSTDPCQLHVAKTDVELFLSRVTSHDNAAIVRRNTAPVGSPPTYRSEPATTAGYAAICA